MKFTDAQTAAINSEAEKTLVVAGAGSGKTEVLVQRIIRLIQLHTPLDGIVVITFTNEAAHEVRRRLATRLGHEVKLGYIGTLHGYCLRLLQKLGAPLGYPGRITVLNEEQADELLKQAAAMMNYRGTFKTLSALRDNWAGYQGPARTEDIVVGAYHRLLKQNGSVDYRLILSEALALTRMAGIKLPMIAHLLVDEFQDSAAIDWDLYCAFKAATMFLVGDPDQAIYQWRGGDVELILMLANDPRWRAIYLQENFRCAQSICRSAQALITNNMRRVPKQTISARDAAGAIDVQGPFANGDQEEMAMVQDVARVIREAVAPPNEVAMLARTNAIVDQLIKLAEAFALPVNKRQPMPADWRFATLTVDMLVNPINDLVFSFWLDESLKLHGHTPNERREAIQNYRDAAAVNNLPLCRAVLKHEDVPMLDAGNFMLWMMKHNVSAESMELINKTVAELDQPSLAEISLALTRDNAPKLSHGAGITITTMHAAKGREWGHVYIVGADQNLVPGQRKSMDVEAERRLFFVAVTRAKDVLNISCAHERKPEHSFKPVATDPSQFIAELV